MTLTQGKTYNVNHTRKGRFTAKLLSIEPEWATLLVVSGKASAILKYNEAHAGDTITVRRDFCEFEEVPE